MVPKSLAFALLGCAACGSVEVTEGPDAMSAPEVDAALEVTPDAVPEPCDLTQPFGELVPLTELNGPDDDEFASLSPDELTIYFASNRLAPGTAQVDLYVATRASVDQPFGEPVNLAVVNSAGDDRSPSVSADGLELYFHSSRSGNYEIYVSTRPNTSAAWSAPGLLGAGVNTAAIETSPEIADGGDTLYFDRTDVNDDYHLFVATRGPTGFDNATELTALGTGEAFSSAQSDDGLTLYFMSNRPGGVAFVDIWVATRATTTAPFGNLMPVAELNTGHQDWFDWLSLDGCRAYVTANPGSAFDLFVATRPK